MRRANATAATLFCIFGMTAVMFGATRARQSPPTTPTLQFEVASLKPHTNELANGIIKAWSCHGSDSKMATATASSTPLGRCAVVGLSLTDLIGIAYPLIPGLDHREITGGPSWVSSDRWDIQAKADSDKATETELRQMFQQLLADRFKLEFHRETKEVQGYGLVVAKNGPKISEDVSDIPAGGMSYGPGGITFKKYKMSSFVNYLGGLAGSPVMDKTGLTALYTFDFQPPPRLSATTDAATDGAPSDGAPSIFTALQEQLGLRLEPQKVPVETIAIDRAEKPAEN